MTMGSRSANHRNPAPDRLPYDGKFVEVLIEAMHEGVVCADQDGTIREVNTAAEDFLSHKRDEMAGKPLFNFLPASLSEHIRDYLSNLQINREQERPVLHEELYGRKLELRLSTLPDGDGATNGIIITLTDETEKRQLENLHRSLEDKLLREQKLSEIGILASGIAHNLNGPLSIIVGYLDLLYSRAGDLEEIPIILAQTERMRDIISNMMIKSRQEQDGRSRTLSLNTLLKNELKFLDANLNFKHNIEKQFEFAVGLPEIYGVYSDFSQSFLNIINNALDAMVDSPVKKLSVKTSFDRENITVEFKDTGCGLDPSDADKLFTPFYTTKPPVGEAEPGHPTGTGLGLSSTYQLIKKYHGTLLVDGSPGNGAHFTVLIPIKENQQPREAKETASDIQSEALIEA